MLHEQADTELWLVLRNELWFVGFMSLYAIWITHLAGWAAETPVEHEDDEALGSSTGDTSSLLRASPRRPQGSNCQFRDPFGRAGGGRA
jgi:hypothetical protein